MFLFSSNKQKADSKTTDSKQPPSLKEKKKYSSMQNFSKFFGQAHNSQKHDSYKISFSEASSMTIEAESFSVKFQVTNFNATLLTSLKDQSSKSDSLFDPNNSSQGTQHGEAFLKEGMKDQDYLFQLTSIFRLTIYGILKETWFSKEDGYTGIKEQIGSFINDKDFKFSSDSEKRLKAFLKKISKKEVDFTKDIKQIEILDAKKTPILTFSYTLNPPINSKVEIPGP